MIRMMKLLFFMLLAFLFSCNSKQNNNIRGNLCLDSIGGSLLKVDTISLKKSDTIKLKVIVLPAYDLISNRGISPNIQENLENELLKSDEIKLIKFPLKQFMHLPYHNIYDKKFCKPITDNIDCHIIIMSKLDLVNKTGKMHQDCWDLEIRVFNTKTGVQFYSQFKADSLSSSGIIEALGTSIGLLVKEIEKSNNFSHN